MYSNYYWTEFVNLLSTCMHDIARKRVIDTESKSEEGGETGEKVNNMSTY